MIQIDTVYPYCCWSPDLVSTGCTRCKQSVTMTGYTPFNASCLFEYTNGQTSTTARKRGSETYLCIDLVERIKYASIRKTIHRGSTLTKWTRVNWMDFDDRWTSYINVAKSDPPRVHMERAACW